MSTCAVCRETLVKVTRHPPGKPAWCPRCEEYRRDPIKPKRWHEAERAGARVKEDE